MSLKLLPCLDSSSMAEERKEELWIPRDHAADLGRTALETIEEGMYTTGSGRRVDWINLVETAVRARVSISPDSSLPDAPGHIFKETRIQVANETTLQAARRLMDAGFKPLALNFANGIHPGGGFLHGSRAQEEVLCRSSALYATLAGDPMYDAHRQRPRPDSTDWVILSPDVPVFRTDDGEALEEPWLVSFITCAAPVATSIGLRRSRELLKDRIHRILRVAETYNYTALVLGAWGCGAFGNDPRTTAEDFREALAGEFDGVFSEVVFGITDWSPERKMLGPFRDVFL